MKKHLLQFLSLNVAMLLLAANSSYAQLSVFPTTINFTDTKPAYITTPSGTNYNTTLTNCSSVVTGGIQHTSSSKSWTLLATKCGKIVYTIKQSSTARSVTISNNKNAVTKTTLGTANTCITDSVDLNYNGSGGDITITFAGASGGSSQATIALTINDLTALPVSFANYNALLQNGAVKINWFVTGEINLQKYVIEKSKDAVNFTEAGFVNAMSLSNYTWLDANTINGTNYYRIKAVDRDGSFKLTSVMKISLGKGAETVSVYPNPVRNGLINIEVAELNKAVYTAKVFNGNGKLVSTNTINHEGGNAYYKLQLPNGLRAGVYNLVLQSNDFKTTKQLFVEN